MFLIKPNDDMIMANDDLMGSIIKTIKENLRDDQKLSDDECFVITHHKQGGILMMPIDNYIPTPILMEFFEVPLSKLGSIPKKKKE